MSRYYDEDDYAQEKALAMLEGMTEDAAENRAARRARRGVYVGGRLAFSYNQTHVLDNGGAVTYEAVIEDHRPITSDSRTPAEVEARFDEADRKAAEARRLLEHCTPPQRAVLELRWGLVTGKKETMQATAEALGYAWHTSAQMHELSGIKRILRKEAEGPVDEATLRRREINRRGQANRRARLRAQQREEAA